MARGFRWRGAASTARAAAGQLVAADRTLRLMPDQRRRCAMRRRGGNGFNLAIMTSIEEWPCVSCRLHQPQQDFHGGAFRRGANAARQVKMRNAIA